MEPTDSYIKINPFLSLFMTAISLLVAYGLIVYVDFGLYLVLGYIFYSIQNIKGLQLINADETNQQLNILHQKIHELSKNKNEN